MITTYDTNNVGELNQYDTYFVIDGETPVIGRKDSVDYTLAFIKEEELLQLIPTRLELVESGISNLLDTKIVYHRDVAAETETHSNNLEVSGEPFYLTTYGFSDFFSKLGETNTNTYEYLVVEGYDCFGNELQEELFINENRTYPLLSPFAKIKTVSLPTVENPEAHIYVTEGKTSSLTPPLKRVHNEDRTQEIFVSLDSEYTDGLRLSTRPMVEVESESYESLYKLYLADSEGEPISIRDFTITEKDEAFVLDTEGRVHFYSSLWPAIQYPTSLKTSELAVNIMIEKEFYDFDEPVHVWALSYTIGNAVDYHMIKIIDPLGDTEYIQADLTLAEETYEMRQDKLDLKFAFTPVMTGTYQIVVESYAGDEVSINEAFIVVPALGAEASFSVDSSLTTIATYHDNQLLLGNGTTISIYQLKYDYAIYVDEQSIYTVETYDTISPI
jgi:hypothetical protein